MISSLYVRKKFFDPEAEILFKRLHLEGYQTLQRLIIERVYRLEGISEEKAWHLRPIFYHSAYEDIALTSTLVPSQGPIVEIGYQKAVTDPELPSILRASAAVGVTEIQWARIFYRYQFFGITREKAQEIAERYLYNPQVQVIISPSETWETLRPYGRTGPIEEISLEGLSEAELLQLSEERRLFLDLEQMKRLQEIGEEMRRPFTDAELEMFAQTWSDHCFHTTWKSLGLLQRLFQTTLKMKHRLVLSAFEDNAGVMRFYRGWALTVKGETHNSPTAISPYGGIMTKHGGVIRDTLGCGLGGWPIGSSTVMGLGDPRMSWEKVPKGALHPKTILLQAIKGTADYCNPMGIPMMFPIYRFHSGYTGKCFALGHSVGLIPAKKAKKGRPRPGDFVLLIGGFTGRDGLHGATVSSGVMTHKTAEVDSAHVQIGHPIEERKFMETIPVLREKGCIRAITDLGAAGLSSAVGEMASETGVWINLAWVPLKTEGLSPWEIWISESQERMLLAVPYRKLKQALNILHQYEVRASVIGKFTRSKRCQVVYRPEISPDHTTLTHLKLEGPFVVDLSFYDLRKRCPLLKIVPKPISPFSEVALPEEPKNFEEWEKRCMDLLSHLNICDQSPAGMQFDSTVQGFTVTGPYGGKTGTMPNEVWISTPLRGKTYGVAASMAFNPLYGELNSSGMVKLAILETVTKLVNAGVDPKDIVLCDNFYTPKISPQVAWVLQKMVATLCEVSEKLQIPFISGKDSSSGTFIDEKGHRIEVPPTLCVFGLSRMKDVRKRIPKPFQEPGNPLVFIGPFDGELGGSLYLDTLGFRGSRLPNPNLAEVQSTWGTLRLLQKKGWIRSGSAIAEGGIFRRIFEMAFGSGLGCEIDLAELKNALLISRDDALLFGEAIGSVILEVSHLYGEKVVSEYGGIPIGKIIEEPRIIIHLKKGQITFSIHDLISVWKKPFQEVAL